MLDHAQGSALLLFLLPVVALLGLILNLVVRARGGRTFTLRLKGFGIDLMLETMPKTRAQKSEVENEAES